MDSQDCDDPASIRDSDYEITRSPYIHRKGVSKYFGGVPQEIDDYGCTPSHGVFTTHADASYGIKRVARSSTHYFSTQQIGKARFRTYEVMPHPRTAIITMRPEDFVVGMGAHLIMSAIQDAGSSTPAPRALVALESIWSHVERLSDAVEARTRRLIRSVAPVPVATGASWITDEIRALRELDEDDRPASASIDSADMLLRALLHAVPEMTRPVIDSGPMCTVEAKWETVTWLIAAPTVTWPAVNVRVYTKDEAAPGGLSARTIRLATSAIDHWRSAGGETHPRRLR